MISLQSVSVSQDNQLLLDAVSLEIAQGETVVLTGPSGCGKSTLLKTLVGGYTCCDGHYLFDRSEVNAAGIVQVRQRCGYIGQDPVLAGETVLACLQQPFQFAAFRDRAFPGDELYRLLDRFVLAEKLLKQPPSSLSGGQKQRFSIVRTLLLGKDVIIADEPTSALDGASKTGVIEELLGGGKTVVSSSHDPDWIRHCDQQVIMENGQLKEVSYEQCG